MPPTTPPARYDLPWKTALTHAFPAFMRFYFPELSAQVDWSKRPCFRDKELAGVGLGDVPDGMVADMLVEICLKEGSLRLVLIHVEIQAQRDATLARRILDYNYRIFKEHGHPVASLVLLADDDPNWRPQAFHNRVLGTVMGISYLTAKLLDFSERTDELLTSNNPFALVTLAHLHAQRAHHDADMLYTAKRHLTKLLYERRLGKERTIMLFKVINGMMALPVPYQQRYWRGVLKLERERNMEWVTSLEQMFIDKGWEKGVKKGRQEGRQEGRKEGAAVMLERQLTRRFGPLPKTVRNKLIKASVAQLEAWSDALPEAQSLKQVFQ